MFEAEDAAPAKKKPRWDTGENDNLRKQTLDDWIAEATAQQKAYWKEIDEAWDSGLVCPRLTPYCQPVDWQLEMMGALFFPEISGGATWYDTWYKELPEELIQRHPHLREIPVKHRGLWRLYPRWILEARPEVPWNIHSLPDPK